MFSRTFLLCVCANALSFPRRTIVVSGLAGLPWSPKPVRAKISVPAESYMAVDLASRGELQKTHNILKTLNQTLGEVSKDTGFSPLFAAIDRNDIKTLKWCLQNNCDPNVKADGKTPLHQAMKWYKESRITRVLLEYAATVDEVEDVFRATPLNYLAESYLHVKEETVVEKASMLLDARCWSRPE
mmetsp:Transcript_14292/g.19105  ORF Transcript_14292/g.19105 Transcript_14292/m.19105 type:complete len:185 (-) Transcript_14292:350-904(-)|eukprot:CAMPEP_0197293492 /NCGR_PEP_ID=MMETSP0890-20130614/28727_1 /TAXON_ID=44058 ORGANISM="Aureoumbra lagunensis, Strain CCMP1510" /NCGR_SAMPLE_ID=MMETSP0890 /ASSEMBLY_ACC=CAM_ASM_000533 /LENGTH=184 /DNA_ID=CAMNT_0042768273 /DNA_START=47 /DNA_END=601 /DNA_ORIENTATION=+